MSVIFRTDQTESEFVIRDHIPKGRAWGFISQFGKALIGAMAECWGYAKAYTDYLKLESRIDTTTDSIDYWEESVLLPDTCSIYAININQRRNQVKIRLRKTPYVTTSEIEQAIYELSGYEVIIRPRRARDNIKTSELDYAQPDTLLFAGMGDLFTLDIYINWESPTSLDSVLLDSKLDAHPRPSVIECLINKLKPCNTLAIFYYSKSQYEAQKRKL